MFKFLCIATVVLLFEFDQASSTLDGCAMAFLGTGNCAGNADYPSGFVSAESYVDRRFQGQVTAALSMEAGGLVNDVLVCLELCNNYADCKYLTHQPDYKDPDYATNGFKGACSLYRDGCGGNIDNIPKTNGVNNGACYSNTQRVFEGTACEDHAEWNGICGNAPMDNNVLDADTGTLSGWGCCSATNGGFYSATNSNNEVITTKSNFCKVPVQKVFWCSSFFFLLLAPPTTPSLLRVGPQACGSKIHRVSTCCLL